VIKEFTADIQIEDPSYLENVRAYQYFSTVFGSTGGPNITLTNGEQTSSYYFNFDTYYFTGALSWNDSAFSAIHSVPNGSGGETITINGIMSADGKTIEHCMIVQTELLSNGGFDYESKLELVDMPVFHHDEWNCWQWFQWNFTGAEAQGYIQNIEFKKYDYQEQEYVTIQSIDWGNSILYGIFDNE
jgi:ribulose bisphosphate carboxylase small subunit